MIMVVVMGIKHKKEKENGRKNQKKEEGRNIKKPKKNLKQIYIIKYFIIIYKILYFYFN